VNRRRPVLIASSSFDQHTHGPVYDRLVRRGFPVVVYLTDQVLSGKKKFSLDISESGSINLQYEGCRIGPEEISAAWHWKVANFRIPDAETNVSKQLTLVNELTQHNTSIWSLYPEDAWLSSPENIWRAERKLYQLVIAERLGFSVPRTHIGNHWAEVERIFGDYDDGMIVKMFRGVIADQNNIRAMYTTRLDPSMLDRLRSRTVPFPGIYQPFIPKAREWRVTVVGDEVFAGAIYTDEDAKDDWRRLQTTAAVALRREALSEEAALLCVKFLRELNLGIGSFDLVEKPDGEIIFLECNPSGQFGFLEEILGLPLSDAVAGRLASIAIQRDGLARRQRQPPVEL
jgi:hypothetical protein